MQPMNLQDWVGREETLVDHVARGPFRRLNALLDRNDDPDERHIPPLGHWLCFLPEAKQSELGEDGHARRGGFMPPVPLPMRMAAGSRIAFHAPVPFGSEIRRNARILKLEEKQGRTGPLAFLTTRYQVFAGDTLCVTEDADVVFRDRSRRAGPLPAGERREAKVSRTIHPDSSLLFRFSALTFNAHRIHYDRDYAKTAEGYPGLVVHGPLLATLLMDLFRTHRPADTVKTFEFRAQRPVFDLSAFTINVEDTSNGADVWASDNDGYVAMNGRIGIAG